MKGRNSVSIKALSASDNAHKPEFFGIIKAVEVLGIDGCPEWEQSGEGLKIKTIRIDDDKPVVFKIVI